MNELRQKILTFLKAVFLTIFVAALMILGPVFGVLFSMDESPKKDRTTEWAAYYEETVSNWFQIPKEARILEAWHREHHFMGFNFRVIFQLPDEKSPVERLEAIAKASKIPDMRRESDLRWGCRNCDLHRISYDPLTKTYIAEGGWD